MRVFLKSTVIFGVTLGAAFPAHAQASAAPGCWTVALGEWVPSAGGDSVLYPRPTWLRLTTDAAGEYFRAARRPNRPPDIIQLDSLRALWRPIGHDSVEVWLPVWWSTGVRARLRVDRDSLNGYATIYVDVVLDSVPRAPVAGHRIKCTVGA